MKRRLLTAIGCIFSISLAGAYSPSAEDEQTIDTVTETLVEIVDGDRLRMRNFIKQLDKLASLYHMHEKLYYLLGEIASELEVAFDERKQEVKKITIEHKQDFLQTYKPEVASRDQELHEGCKEYYELLDDLAFAYDHPTSLLIAIRYRESTCGFYLPNNTWGPFQIMSKNYGAGEISIELFQQTVEDYLIFSEGKHDLYERANYDSGYVVDLSYTGWSLTGVVYHSSLYNGLSGANIRGTIAPGIPEYVYDNYTNAYSGATRDGIVATMIKVIDRELQQHEESNTPTEVTNAY